MAKERLAAHKIAIYLLMITAITSCDRAFATELSVDINNCHPCSFAFNVQSNATNQSNNETKIEVITPIRQQHITLPEKFKVENIEKIDLSAIDINFDGYSDILINASPAPTSDSHYWIFNPKLNQFEYTGEYPQLKIDAIKKQLYTIEHDPHDNRIYQKTYYQFKNGTLAQTSSEKHEATHQSGVYKKSEFQLENGPPKLIKVEYAYGPSGI